MKRFVLKSGSSCFNERGLVKQGDVIIFARTHSRHWSHGGGFFLFCFFFICKRSVMEWAVELLLLKTFHRLFA